MHILILATTSDVASKMQSAMGDVADRCAVATAWADVFSQLTNDRPDLILVERSILSRTEISTLNSLSEPGSWPPLLFVDALASGAATGIVVAQRVSQEASHYYQIQ